MGGLLIWLGGKALFVAVFAALCVVLSLLTRYVGRLFPDGPLKRVLYREENDPPPVPGSAEHLAQAKWARMIQWYLYAGLPALILAVYWLAGGRFWGFG